MARITPITFRAYRIDAKDNKNVKYLYNKAYDILSKEQQTVTYATDYIQFDKLTETMRLAFEKLKIKVEKISK